MKLRKAVVLTAVILISTVSGFRRTSIVFNEDTGGYEDVVVVVSPELSANSCPQILHNIKVRDKCLGYKFSFPKTQCKKCSTENCVEEKNMGAGGADRRWRVERGNIWAPAPSS